MEEETEQKLFRKVQTRHIATKLSSKDELLIPLIKLRVGILVTDLSQHSGRHLVAITLKFYIRR